MNIKPSVRFFAPAAVSALATTTLFKNNDFFSKLGTPTLFVVGACAAIYFAKVNLEKIIHSIEKSSFWAARALTASKNAGVYPWVKDIPKIAFLFFVCTAQYALSNELDTSAVKEIAHFVCTAYIVHRFAQGCVDFCSWLRTAKNPKETYRMLAGTITVSCAVGICAILAEKDFYPLPFLEMGGISLAGICGSIFLSPLLYNESYKNQEGKKDWRADIPRIGFLFATFLTLGSFYKSSTTKDIAVIVGGVYVLHRLVQGAYDLGVRLRIERNKKASKPKKRRL
ncbi:MAG: hypothetical protein JSR58_07300 [Verrucomicrobia bacterium]|nr:hypothetical protein [Verrucomicrobiota bacterium]